MSDEMDEAQMQPFNPKTVKALDLMARRTTLLAMELARECLKSSTLQISESPRAARIREICYTLLGTGYHRAEPDEDAAIGRLTASKEPSDGDKADGK